MLKQFFKNKNILLLLLLCMNINFVRAGLEGWIEFLQQMKQDYPVLSQTLLIGTGIASVMAVGYTYKKSDEKKLSTLNFWEFKKRCNALPVFQCRNNYQNIDQENQKTALTSFMIHKAIDNYFAVLLQSTDFDRERWVDGEVSTKVLEMIQQKNDYSKNPKEQFDPCVQKLIIEDGMQVALFGDRHGDIHSLLNCMVDLADRQLLDINDPFKIRDPNFCMIFHGDYTDRGWYGAEVLYTILRLKHANPNQVFLIRGNHEDEGVNEKERANSFFYEIKNKFPKTIWDKIFFRNLNNGQKIWHKTSKVYETMPLALFLGCKNIKKDKTNYALCCHGGVEIGFDAMPLLSHKSPKAFTKLGELKRATQIDKMYKDEACVQKFAEAAEVPIASAKELQNNFNKTLISEEVQNFKPVHIKSTLYHTKGNYTTNSEGMSDLNWAGNAVIGFQWNDKEVDETIERNGVFVKPVDGRGWKIGKTFNHCVLGLYGDDQNIVRGVFRAHQHTNNPKDPMMKRILNTDGLDHDDNRGIGRLWLPKNVKQLPKEKLWENFVCTMNVAPGTPYQDAGFHYDTYGLLTICEKFKDWRLEPVRVSSGQH